MYWLQMKHFLRTLTLGKTEETLTKGNVKGIDGLSFPSAFLKISNGFSSTGTATTAFVVIALNAI